MLNIVSPITYSLFTYPCPMWVHLHFPKLNNICHFSDHLTNFCNVSLSAYVCTVLNTFVLSANYLISHPNNYLYYISKLIWLPTPTSAAFHLKLVSSLISHPLLLLSVFCLSTMFVINWSYFPLYHRILIELTIFDVALYRMLSENINKSTGEPSPTHLVMSSNNIRDWLDKT